MSARLVIVGGAPATGKTTLAIALGQALSLPVITKDDLKESIAEPFETGDREWSRRLGRSAYAVLWTVARQILSSGSGLVLESNFTPQANAALREVSFHAPTVVVLCRVSDALRRRRFAERAAGGRHRVHLDHAYLGEWNADDSDFLVDIGAPSLVVDTTDGYVPGLERIVAFAHAAARDAMREWPADWAARRRGKDCPMCAEGRPEDNGFGPRVFAGRYTDAYLQRRDVGQPGYTVAIWRGRHVAELTELSAGEARDYLAEVLSIARAVEAHYRPIKMNFDILGNTVPHLHTHILPRYRDDGGGMQPARLMRGQVTDQRQIPEEAITRDAAALRDLLR